MQALILCLFVAIIILQAVIIYLLLDEPEPQPVKKYPRPEFPAKRTLQDMERDFDKVAQALKERPKATSRAPRQRVIPTVDLKPRRKKSQDREQQEMEL